MDSNWIKELFSDMVIKWVVRFILGVVLLILICTLVFYSLDRSSGVHAKMFWGLSECHIQKEPPDTVYSMLSGKHDTLYKTKHDTIKITKYLSGKSSEPKKQDTVIVGKNINTGINNGNIGDTYSERQLTDDDKTQLIAFIEKLKTEKNINRNCIMLFSTQGSNGGKLLSQMESFLVSKGYSIDSKGISVTSVEIKGVAIGVQMGCISITVGVL